MSSGSLQIELSVINDSISTLDLNDLYYKDDRTGTLVLQNHITIRWVIARQETYSHRSQHVNVDLITTLHCRDLVASLQSAEEGLCLEYWCKEIEASKDAQV
jgi:hypothetical protein